MIMRLVNPVAIIIQRWRMLGCHLYMTRPSQMTLHLIFLVDQCPTIQGWDLWKALGRLKTCPSLMNFIKFNYIGSVILLNKISWHSFSMKSERWGKLHFGLQVLYFCMELSKQI